MKRVFKASDSITKRALEATKRALEAKDPEAGPLPGRRAAEAVGIREPREKGRIGRPPGAKNKPKGNPEKPTKLVGNMENMGAKVPDIRESNSKETNGLSIRESNLSEKGGNEVSVSGAIGPAAMAEWNRQLAELCQSTMKGAPKKLLLQKPSDLKLVDDLMRRANGVAGANAGSSHPGNLVQINFLDSIGKERQENIRVVTSPFPQDDDA